MKTGRMVYLAGPIDAVKCGAKWRLEAEQWLHFHGLSFFKPWDAYSLPNLYASRDVMQINRAAVMHSSGVLALLPYGVTTIGTIREIEIAATAEVPIVVVADWNADAHVSLYDVRVESTVQQGVSTLKQLMGDK